MLTETHGVIDPASLWQGALEALRGKLPDHVHQTLCDLMRPVEVRERTLIVEVPNSFLRDMLKGEHHVQMEAALRAIAGDSEFALFVRPSAEPSPRENPPSLPPEGADPAASPAPAVPRASLNTRYMFDRFVIGNSNRFAFSAAQAVAQDPVRAYNPLIIWGGVGLGKTHLLHAIGHAMAARQPTARILCISSETFLNDYVRALTERKTMELKARYRQADLLLMDDIQFLEGKEATQDEFFHTFNDLVESRHQIVATSDRHPSELSRLEDRLRSRLQMGLVVVVGAPDFELRLAILRTKAHSESVPLPDDVAHFLAEARDANVRELEGDLTTVVAFCSMHGLPLTVENAQAAVRGRMQANDRKITPDAIQREICRHFSVRLPDLTGQARTAELVRARQVAMYLCRQLLPTLSLSDIGTRFGGRDHTTVIHSIEKIQTLCETDPRVAEEIQRLSKLVRALP